VKDKLVVECGRGGVWRIQWMFEDAEGGYLGQSSDDGDGEPPEDKDSWQHWAASKAAKSAPGAERDSISAFWETESQARVALRLAKEALKQVRPLPDWAKTALAAGWKPPKGWKA
jgi:hypothetical protein